MDEIDRKILAILEKDSRIGFVDIAKQIGLTEGAVRKRVKDLVDKGIIKKFTIVKSAGTKVINAIILIKTDTKVSTDAVSSKINSIGGVSEVYEVSGNFDIICFASGDDVPSVNETIENIRKVRGVSNTATTFILK